jgi:hypothetical protein
MGLQTPLSDAVTRTLNDAEREPRGGFPTSRAWWHAWAS